MWSKYETSDENRQQLVNAGAIPVLVSLLNSPDTDVQYYCTTALSNIAVDGSSPLLIIILSCPRRFPRCKPEEISTKRTKAGNQFSHAYGQLESQSSVPSGTCTAEPRK
jgi:hypothetical protein